jgi:ferredoxin-NADP reductase
MTTGVFADGKLVQRPYSVASAPSVAGEGYELYVKLVPVIRFTTALWRLPVGHRMRMIGPKGRFLLEPGDDRTHLYVSTGTGIAPFISMMRQTLADGRPRRTVMLNGCSYADELGYRELLEEWERDGGYPCRGRTIRATPGGAGGPAAWSRSSSRSAVTCASGRSGRSSTSAATPR